MGDEIRFKAYEPPLGQPLAGFRADARDPSAPLFFVDDVVEGLDLPGVRTTPSWASARTRRGCC